MSDITSLVNIGFNASMVFNILMLLVGMGLLAFACWMVYDFMSYNYFVTIIDKRGRSSLKINKKGRIEKTKQGTRFKIRGIKQTVKLPEKRYFFSTYGFMKKGYIVFYRYGENSFVPVDMNVSFKNEHTGAILDLHPIEQDLAEISNLMEEGQKYEIAEFWEKWGVVVTYMIGTSALIAVQVIILFMVKDISGGLSGSSQALATACSDVVQSCNAMNPSIIQGVS